MSMRYRLAPALALVLLFAAVGSAVSIQPAKIEMAFAPGQTTQFSFYIGGADKIASYVDGELAKYATIFDPFNGTGPRHISITLRLPEEGVLEPGRRTLLVGAAEIAEFGEIGGLARIQAPVYVEVPYPGIFLTMDLAYADGDINSIIPITISTTNKGTLEVGGVKASLDIYENATSNKMLSLNSTSRSISPRGGANFKFNVDTTGWALGAYRVRSLLSYEGGEKERDGLLRLGTLGLKIVDFTASFEPDTINAFAIEVENIGSIPLQDVYGEISIGGKAVRTTPQNIPGWHKVNLTGYFDTTGIAEGKYTTTATVYYADKFAQLTKDVSLARLQQGASQELPVAIPADSSLIIAALLIIIGVIFLLLRRRNG